MVILYVEDDANDYTLVQRYAQAMGYDLLVATNADDAAQTLQQYFPDMMLVDIVLNDTRQGYDFVQWVRSVGYDRAVVAVTGLSLPNEMAMMQQVGFNDVLLKPYTINQLADTITRYLS
jgi:DNA-binding response OmpR family regulator